MRIFITSGGTKVPIDPVRSITNMSEGTFGSKIAKEALNQGHEVIYYISDGHKHPFEIRIDLYEYDHDQCLRDLMSHANWCDKMRNKYELKRYKTFDDYALGIEGLLKEFKPDVIILAAAVSDYITVPKKKKVKSSEDLTINLTPAEKIISKVKGWCPDAVLVGFKLLVGGTKEELDEASTNSIKKNDCDLVVGNDLVELRAGNHKITLYKKEGETVTCEEFTEEMPFHIIEAAVSKAKSCSTSL
jgi:phosphopantothenate---cysteine ligase (CTP)